jgi:hypothetical protein
MATKKCTTCGKNRKMAEGGSSKNELCPKGEFWDGEKCVKNISQRVAAGTFAAGLGSIIGVLAGTSDKAMARSKARDAKKDAKKVLNKKIDDAAKKLTSNVMKKGGMVKKSSLVKKRK